MADGKVIFDIVGNSSGIQSALDETTAKIKQAGADWDSEAGGAADGISSKLIAGFKAVTMSAAFLKISQMLIQLGMESINVASDLEEVQNVVDVTFGSSGASKINDWAKTAQAQFGLTELQAKQFASTIGAMFKSSGLSGSEIEDMSMAVAGLAADMASFYNMDFQTAFDKIRAGISGEIEPLRQLGINMSIANLEAFAMAQGIETAWKDMSQAEQTLLRYQYIMAATADAQGDFARTSDGYANSQRRITTGLEALKAALGEVLLPIATQVSNAVADFLELLTMPPEKTVVEEAGENMGKAVSDAASAVGLLSYLDQLQQKYGDAATQTAEWQAALEALKQVFPEINGYIDSETGALTATNEQLRQYIENMKQAAIEKAKQAAMQKLTDAYAEAVVQYAQESNAYETHTVQANAQFDALVEYVVNGMIESAQKNAARLGEEFDISDYPELNKDYWMNGFRNGEISMDELVGKAIDLAYERGDDTSIIKAYQQAYEEHAAAASTAAANMETLTATMTSLEGQMAMTQTALAKMAEQAGAAATTLGSLAGATIPGGAGGSSSGGSFSPSFNFTHSHALGLDFVPYDNYFARLHEGEGILTAEENRIWQNFKNHGTGMDYDTLGNVMRDNVRGGGNVYLDGVTVGRVISGRQADSYRALERSGWQS